jgi:hypothetical protein
MAAAEAGHPPGLLVDLFGVTVGRGGIGPGTPLTPGRHRGSPICWHGSRTWTPRYRSATRQFIPQAAVLPLELGHLRRTNPVRPCAALGAGHDGIAAG